MAPQAKRQLTASQQHITSFYSPVSTADYNQSFQTASHEGLDKQTQANLINVGMRTRKAMAESLHDGRYQSRKKTSVESLTQPPISTALSTAAQRTLSSFKHIRPRELVPFSGIHSVGGLAAQQQWAHQHGMAMDDEDSDDRSPPPSQESMTCNPSMSQSKRHWAEDAQTPDLSSRVAPAGRPIAIPRRMKYKTSAVEKEDDVDFDDADFLDYDLANETNMEF